MGLRPQFQFPVSREFLPGRGGMRVWAAASRAQRRACQHVEGWIAAARSRLGGPAEAELGAHVFGGCASAMAILRASVVINSIWVRSLRWRLSRTIRLMQTQM